MPKNIKALVAIAFFIALLVVTFWQVGSPMLHALVAGVFMVSTLLYARTATTRTMDAAALLIGLVVLYVLAKAALLSPLAFTPEVLAASFAAGLFCEGFLQKERLWKKGCCMGIIFVVFLISIGVYPVEGKDFPSFSIVFFWGMSATIGSPKLVNCLLLRSSDFVQKGQK